jgi:putative CocE/NonD family hydrolase
MTPAYTSDVPALFINSWYDFGADITLAEFNHLRATSVSQIARDHQFAIISPHSHCDFERGASEHTRIGELEVGDTRFDYRKTYLTWFDAWLKDDASARAAIRAWPKLRYYNMGRNRWQQAGQWPVAGTVEREFLIDSTLGANSLAGDGVLREGPAEGAAANVAGSAADRFVYDPANPVPSRGGSMCCTGSPDAVAGALDQRPVEARSDVLVYTSEPLVQVLDVTGIPRVVLHVSSDVVDTDFTAKLVDVHPDGRAFNILEGILRARYREGQDREVWMAPGGVYEVTVPLGATSNVFLPGHRIRLEISSSNFPRFDRNLNLGGINAEHTTWRVANNTIHHTPELRSRLLLPVVPAQVKR